MPSSSAPAPTADQDPPPPPLPSSSNSSASSTPWSQVVRGDPDRAISFAELPPSTEANRAGADQSHLLERQEDRASAAMEAPTNRMKPTWRRPTNGADEAGGPIVMGAVSWPALSESAKASPKSLPASSDVQKPLADGSIPSIPAPSTKGSNSTSNQTFPVRQKSFKRGGGGGGTSSIADAPTNGVASQQMSPPPATSGVATENPVAGPEISPRDRSNKGINNWDDRPRGGGGGGGDHHRGYRRGNNGGTGSHQNNNYGNRWDHERRSYDGYSSERGVHMQQRSSRPHNRPPPPVAPPFMNLPPQARPFLNPVVYPDMPPPVVYITPPPPELFRGFPFVPHPLASPLAFSPVIDSQRSTLLYQIDYYFSNENLCKDLFLRKNMDEHGWVPLSLIAGFNRLSASPVEDMDPETKSEEVIGYNNVTAKTARLKSMLSALLDDPVLSDVPKRPTLMDVDILINLELGSAMRLSIIKMDNTSFDVAVLNSSTVKDLKLAIMKKVNEIEQAKMGHRHISWRHVWANFCLAYHNEKLIDDKELLVDHGINNNGKVHFLPYVASRELHKHSKRRKHRFFHGLSKRV